MQTKKMKVRAAAAVEIESGEILPPDSYTIERRQLTRWYMGKEEPDGNPEYWISTKAGEFEVTEQVSSGKLKLEE